MIFFDILSVCYFISSGCIQYFSRTCNLIMELQFTLQSIVFNVFTIILLPLKFGFLRWVNVPGPWRAAGDGPRSVALPLPQPPPIVPMAVGPPRRQGPCAVPVCAAPTRSPFRLPLSCSSTRRSQ